MERNYKGKTLRLQVTESGFQFAGKDYASLTAAALAATGYRAISGTAFWGVAGRGSSTATKEGAKTRRAFIERYADKKVLIIGSHFCEPTGGWIVRDGAAWRLAVR